jgi:DNA replication protein DnaC
VTLGFLARGENILFRGQAGVGKSTLAKHLGLAALAKGHSVRFEQRQEDGGAWSPS